MDLTFIHFLAVKSAADVNPMFPITILTDGQPSGKWWDAAEAYVARVERKIAPNSINGIINPHPAHKADYIRLRELLTNGSVY